MALRTEDSEAGSAGIVVPGTSATDPREATSSPEATALPEISTTTRVENDVLGSREKGVPIIEADLATETEAVEGRGEVTVEAPAAEVGEETARTTKAAAAGGAVEKTTPVEQPPLKLLLGELPSPSRPKPKRHLRGEPRLRLKRRLLRLPGAPPTPRPNLRRLLGDRLSPKPRSPTKQ